MTSTNYMKEMSWTTFVERTKETDLVLLPTGACEVYGPHLPLGSDLLVATIIAEKVATRVNAIIGPALEVGDSSALDDFPGTITIRPESYKSYLQDVVNVSGLVDTSKGIDEVPKQKDLFPEIIKYSRYSTKTESGVIGYSTTATSQKGEVLVQRSVDRIVHFLYDTWDIPHS